MFQALDSYAQDIVEFARVHEVWTTPIAFMLAFGESLAFVSLFIPAWAALVGLGALIEAGELRFWPIWIGGAMGQRLETGPRIGWALILVDPSLKCGPCRDIQRCCQEAYHLYVAGVLPLYPLSRFASPFLPMGGIDLDCAPQPRIYPRVINSAAGENEGVDRSVGINHSKPHVAVCRNLGSRIDVVPHDGRRACRADFDF